MDVEDISKVYSVYASYSIFKSNTFSLVNVSNIILTFKYTQIYL